MTKRLIATVLAASLALTSLTAAPARATDSGELGRMILGAGALLIIGSAIANSNNNSPRYSTPHVTTRHGHPPFVTPRYVNPHPRVAPHRRLLPSACLRVTHGRNGPFRYFSTRCLQNNMRHAGNLPGGCLTTIRGNRGRHTVYSARCLRQHGYRFSG